MHRRSISTVSSVTTGGILLERGYSKPEFNTGYLSTEKHTAQTILAFRSASVATVATVATVASVATVVSVATVASVAMADE